MKKTHFLLYTAFAFLLLVGFEACQSSKASTSSKMLKFNLEKNKGYDYELTMNMDQEIMGQDLQMDMTYYYSMDVESEEADTKTITSSIDRFKLKTGVMGLTIDVDTDKPYDAADTTSIMSKQLGTVNKLFAAVKGKKFTMKVNSEGKIMSVTGFENMGESIADSLGLDPKEREEMLKEFNGQVNADEMTQSLGRFWYIFPNKEVKVGDTWQKTMKMGGKMPGNYKSNYKVTEIEGDMVTVDEKSTIEADEADEVGMNGTITGTMVIDSRSGLVVSADQDMTIKASAQGVSFDIKAKTKLKGKAR